MASPQTKTTTTSGTRSGILAQAFAAMLFGVFLIGAAGFAHSEVLHNAAHDVRHSNAFPCH